MYSVAAGSNGRPTILIVDGLDELGFGHPRPSRHVETFRDLEEELRLVDVVDGRRQLIV